MPSPASTTMIEVPGGWLITILKDGRYAPFFVKVRESDIHWSDKVPAEIVDAVGIYNDYEVINPSSYIESEINGWKCKFNTDLTCEFVKEIRMDRGFSLQDNDCILRGLVELPVKLDPTSGFIPSVSISTRQEELRTATISVSKIVTNEVVQNIGNLSYIESFEIFMANPIYRFHSNFKEIYEYMETSIYITIRGNLLRY